MIEPRDMRNSVTIDDVNNIFLRITEEFQEAIPIGGRCESNFYYRTEELTEDELDACAEYVAERLDKIISPSSPNLFLKLPGGYSFFAERLCYAFSQKFNYGEELPLETYTERALYNGLGDRYRNYNCILVTDVITTAKSSLEAHTKVSLKSIPILSWATLIDRTFGPGPVPVASAFTGAPVRVLSLEY